MSRLTLVLRLAYPRGWRERYGPELEALTADVGLSPRVAVDLVRSGLRQRAEGIGSAGDADRALGPAQSHPSLAALLAAVLLAPTAAFVTGSLLAYNLGVAGLQPVMHTVGSWLDGTPPLSALLVLAAPASAILAASPMLTIRPAAGSGGRLAFQLRQANVIVLAAALLVGAILVWYAAGEL
jgi:hypothetical protein